MRENWFKIALTALLLADASVRLYYLKGRRKFERVAVKHEKRENFFYRLVGMGLIPISYYLLTPRIDAFRLPFPAWLRWSGAAIIFAGDLLFIWSHRALDKNWSPLLEIRKGHTLVTEGPYRFIRHPMYAAIFLIGTGILFLSANWTVASSYMLPVIFMYLIRVSDEEEMMVEQFGDEYRKYMKSTGRLLPKLNIKFNPVHDR
ncbi:MAG TPA: isoprenylcysteine carboxylmethyltransferase family protein [Methanosarcina sp.]|nr:isoprenylcysteine carboxylmethyltransferase family protein [Methanosarcina sp.]